MCRCQKRSQCFSLLKTEGFLIIWPCADERNYCIPLHLLAALKKMFESEANMTLILFSEIDYPRSTVSGQLLMFRKISKRWMFFCGGSGTSGCTEQPGVLIDLLGLDVQSSSPPLTTSPSGSAALLWGAADPLAPVPNLSQSLLDQDLFSLGKKEKRKINLSTSEGTWCLHAALLLRIRT